jgi:hypothetical protein
MSNSYTEVSFTPSLPFDIFTADIVEILEECGVTTVIRNKEAHLSVSEYYINTDSMLVLNILDKNPEVGAPEIIQYLLGLPECSSIENVIIKEVCYGDGEPDASITVVTKDNIKTITLDEALSNSTE